MPLMRAKFERCGQPIPMRIEKRDYIFQKDHTGDFVAMVDAENHVNYLIETGNFEIVPANRDDLKDVDMVDDELDADDDTSIAKKACPTTSKKITKAKAEPAAKDSDEASFKDL